MRTVAFYAGLFFGPGVLGAARNWVMLAVPRTKCFPEALNYVVLAVHLLALCALSTSAFCNVYSELIKVILFSKNRNVSSGKNGAEKQCVKIHRKCNTNR